MNETLYGWTFKFHKVVRQQNSGAVDDFILPYSAVYPRIQKWKNYWNRSTFAKVIVKIKVARFLWPTVYNIVVLLLCRPLIVVWMLIFVQLGPEVDIVRTYLITVEAVEAVHGNR